MKNPSPDPFLPVIGGCFFRGCPRIDLRFGVLIRADLTGAGTGMAGE